jgi:hypothetical protein
LKELAERNKGKARGGRREPKKNALMGPGSSDHGRDNPAALSQSDFSLLDSLSYYSLDEERAAACGTGVPCYF